MKKRMIGSLAVLLLIGGGVLPIETTALPASRYVSAQVETVPSATPAEKENAGTVFEGFTVTVTDSKTPAEMALGTDWPITTLYFMAENGDHLGSISGTAYNAIMKKYRVLGPAGYWDAPGSNGDWEFWFAEEFNAYRGISSSSKGFDTSSKNNSENASDNKTDTSNYALEVVELTNAKRREAGLDELEISQDMMNLAQIRAEEIVANFDHVRPDGVRISALGYGENISKGRDTPSAVVKAWMNSDGHKANMMNNEYQSIGVGCYLENETYHWVQLFSWNE